MFSEWCFFSSGFSFVLYNSTVRLCRYHNRASVYRRSVAFNLYEATILYRCDRWVYYRLEKSFAQSAGLAGIRTRTIRFKTSSSGVFECALSVPLFFFFFKEFIVYNVWKLSLLIQCILTFRAYLRCGCAIRWIAFARNCGERIFVNSAGYSKVQPASTANTCWHQRDSCQNRNKKA